MRCQFQTDNVSDIVSHCDYYQETQINVMKTTSMDLIISATVGVRKESVDPLGE